MPLWVYRQVGVPRLGPAQRLPLSCLHLLGNIALSAVAAAPVKKWGVMAGGPDRIGTTSPCLLMDTKVSLVPWQSQRRVWERDREWVAADVVLELPVCRAVPGASGGDGLMVIMFGSFGGRQTTCFPHVSWFHPNSKAHVAEEPAAALPRGAEQLNDLFISHELVRGGGSKAHEQLPPASRPGSALWVRTIGGGNSDDLI